MSKTTLKADRAKLTFLFTASTILSGCGGGIVEQPSSVSESMSTTGSGLHGAPVSEGLAAEYRNSLRGIDDRAIASGAHPTSIEEARQDRRTASIVTASMSGAADLLFENKAVLGTTKPATDNPAIAVSNTEPNKSAIAQSSIGTTFDFLSSQVANLSTKVGLDSGVRSSRRGPPAVAPSPAPITPPATQWVTAERENQSFTIGNPQRVRYGIDSRWIEKTLTGNVICSNDFFGADPAVGVVKQCQIFQPGAVGALPAPKPIPIPIPAPAPAPAPPPAAGPQVTAWVRLAREDDSFTTTGSQSVRFGNGLKWEIKQIAGEGTCSSGYFGVPKDWSVNKVCEVQRTVPTVAQAGKFPVVNVALIPGAAKSFSNPRVRTLTPGDLTLPVFQPVSSDNGAFRVPCAYSHMAFDDPIVFPNRPGASHLHTFYGNAQTNANSTVDSLGESGASTCAGGTLNRSAYWIPTLVDIRTGQPIVSNGSMFYYKQGYQGVKGPDIKVFPTGLRMIAGDSQNALPVAGYPVRLKCLLDGREHSSMPSCPVGDSLLFMVIFPQCWDGINLDSPDHKSHMAYGNGGGCPTTHPVALPEITINVGFLITEPNSAAFLRLSSDNMNLPGGYSMHADWFDGWDVPTNMTFTRECLNKNKDCHGELLGDGRTLF